MMAALLAYERTDLASTNMLRHSCAYQKLAYHQATFRAGCKDGCDLAMIGSLELQPICRDQISAQNSMT